MILVYIVCHDRDEARMLARLLLEERLAAGANIIPCESLYWWQGQIVEDDEQVLLAKTRPECFEALTATVKSLHSYETPAIMRLPVADADPQYLAWIQAETHAWEAE